MFIELCLLKYIIQVNNIICECVLIKTRKNARGMLIFLKNILCLLHFKPWFHKEMHLMVWLALKQLKCAYFWNLYLCTYNVTFTHIHQFVVVQNTILYVWQFGIVASRGFKCWWFVCIFYWINGQPIYIVSCDSKALLIL